jgi:dipeptidyl-peptidase-4
VRAEKRAGNLVNEAFLEQYAATHRFNLGKPTSIRVTRDGDAVLFLRSTGPRSFVQDLYQFDVATGQESKLLTAEQVLAGREEEISPEEQARRERTRTVARGIVSYSLSEDGRTIVVPLSGRLFVVDRAAGTSRELRPGADTRGHPIDPQLSPDGRKLACVRDGDLYVYDFATSAETRLTDSGSATISNGVAEFVAQEEMHRHSGFWWSPDSSAIVYQQTDTAGLETFTIADPMRPEKSAKSWPYPRAGRKNATVTLGIISASGGSTRWIDWDRSTYPYLATVRWTKNAPLTLLVQNRLQNEQLLLAADDKSGATRVLLKETDDTWLNLDQSSPAWLEDGSAFLWTTERSGAWQLELRDGRDGKLIRALTEPSLGLRGVAGVDAKDRIVYVTASQDPTQTHVWRVPIDAGPGAKPQAVSSGRGSFGAVVARDGATVVITSSTSDGASDWSVRKRDGTTVGSLRSIAETPSLEPKPQWTTAGLRDFNCVIVRPRDFDASRKYPVVLNVYGGPHGIVVSAPRDGYLLPQWLADQGFIVVASDGRGTPHRGRDWERVTHLNFIDIPLDDQIDALQSLGQKFPEMDMSRVAISGWSFGGYFAAMAIMRRPDVFGAAVAGAPVCDFADYDTHYTERYLGLPDENTEGYRACNVLTYAKDLSRPLLIIHGTADDNVYFLHSLKLTDALFRAGKDFEFLPLSGFTHMVPEPEVTVRLQTRIVEFLKKQLDGR